MLALLALPACGSPEPAKQDAEARVAPAATPVTSTRAQAVPEPTAPASAPAALRLAPEGLGPLKIGMTLAQVTDAWGADAEPDAVGGADPASCDQFRPARAPQGVLVMIENGRLTRISLIRENPIRTDRGVGLGSTADAVRGAYKGTVAASPHKYRDAPSEYLTHWARKAVPGDRTTPTDRGIVFEVDGRGIVDLVHAGGPSIQYVEGCS